MHRTSLRKLHSFTGLVPLAAYLAFHVWEHWPVREGRDAAIARMERTAAAPIEIGFVLLPLFVHAVLGMQLARTPDSSAAYAGRSFRRMQAVTGALTALFLLWHVGGVWLPRVVAAGRAAPSYGAMLDQAGPIWGMLLYVVGISAACVHLSQGLAAAWIRHADEVSPRLARGLTTALGIALWVCMIELLAVYATGAPLL